MGREDDGSAGPLQNPIKGVDVVREEVSGIGAAMAATPSACKSRMTRLQLDPSAQAPWTITTAGLLDVLMTLFLL
jgi:hypothetical protein